MTGSNGSDQFSIIPLTVSGWKTFDIYPKMKLIDSADRLSNALLVVFIFLCLIASIADRKLSGLGSEAIAPENLRSAVERFRLQLLVEQNSEIRAELSESDPRLVLNAVEENSASIDRIAETESWNSLEANLSHYADRLELLTEQRHSMSMTLYYATAAIAVASLIFTIARTRARSRRAEGGSPDQPATDPVNS